MEESFIGSVAGHGTASWPRIVQIDWEVEFLIVEAK
jgi:hypothetical protein